jgi:NADPH-dependent curcumin reductase CurA
MISGYNDDTRSGPSNFGILLTRRVHLEGFIVLDHFGRAREIVPQLAGWMAEGKLKAQETVVEGFEQLPVAINMLFDGKNTGKLVVKL